MTAKPINELWSPQDEEEANEGKKRLIERIGAAKALALQYEQMARAENNRSRFPTMKAHYSISYLMQLNHVDALEMELSIAESFVELLKTLGAAFRTIEHQMQEISEKTGIDITQIKTDMAQVKETVNAPIYKYLREQKESDEKIRKRGEETLDWATRSH